MGTFQSRTSYLYVGVGALLIVSFQNCSKVDFSPAKVNSLTKASSTDLVDVEGENGHEIPGWDDNNGNSSNTGNSSIDALLRVCEQTDSDQPTGTNLVDAPDISHISGGQNFYEFKSIGSIGKISGGTSYFYASGNIGHIESVAGGVHSIVANSINSIGSISGGKLSITAHSIGVISRIAGGSVCIRANNIEGILNYAGGNYYLESLGSEKGTINRLPASNGGTRIYRNYNIDTMHSGAGGYMRVEDSLVKVLELGSGGVVEVVNSHVERIVRSGSSTHLKLINSTYGSIH